MGFEATGFDVEFVEQLAEHGGVKRALGGGLDAAPQTAAQGQAEPLLQLGYMAADSTLRHPQFAGGFGQAAIAGSGLKSPQGVERGEGSGHLL